MMRFLEGPRSAPIPPAVARERLRSWRFLSIVVFAGE